MKCEPSELQRTLFFSLILVWLIAMIFGISEPPIVVRGVAWPGIVIGVSSAWFGLKQMFRKGPTLIINESGIDDKRLGVGQIPWTAISSVSTYKTLLRTAIDRALAFRREYIFVTHAAPDKNGRSNPRGERSFAVCDIDGHSDAWVPTSVRVHSAIRCG
jgi:hypothetical protein